MSNVEGQTQCFQTLAGILDIVIKAESGSLFYWFTMRSTTAYLLDEGLDIHLLASRYARCF